jgi:hypothetical protein
MMKGLRTFSNVVGLAKFFSLLFLSWPVSVFARFLGAISNVLLSVLLWWSGERVLLLQNTRDWLTGRAEMNGGRLFGQAARSRFYYNNHQLFTQHASKYGREATRLAGIAVAVRLLAQGRRTASADWSPSTRHWRYLALRTYFSFLSCWLPEE